MGLLIRMEVYRSSEFTAWFKKLSLRTQGAIDSRIFRIEEHEHFGDCKYIKEKIAELRWKNGIRIYFLNLDTRAIFLLIGGMKNEQKKNIKKAKFLTKKYAYSEIKD